MTTLRQWGPLLLVALLLTLEGACSFRKVGKDLAGGALSEVDSFLVRPRTQTAVRTFSDSTLATVGTSVDSQLAPRVRALADSLRMDATMLLGAARDTLREMETDLAHELDTSIADALDSVLERGLNRLGDQGSAELDTLLATLGAGLRKSLSPALASIAKEAGDSLSVTLARRVRSDIGPAFKEAAESTLVATARGVEGTPLWRTIVYLAIGAIAVTAFVAVTRLVRDRRMSRKSLELITDQIDRLPDSEPLKEAIQDHARRADVESWLHGFLEKRRRVEL